MLVQWADDIVLLTIASNRNESVDAIKTVAEARHLQTVLLDAKQSGG